ncbi:hypothetical protein H5410_059724 [Solanum commersonii]|uniref:Transmembrane protein n=1 Tax=Solanum commersonii TaxID=4109 RepID=A0A9J5W4C2_SOLCO|nr:hypothetical protein H5410_059724 [Solanum commersonii]
MMMKTPFSQKKMRTSLGPLKEHLFYSHRSNLEFLIKDKEKNLIHSTTIRGSVAYYVIINIDAIIPFFLATWRKKIQLLKKKKKKLANHTGEVTRTGFELDPEGKPGAMSSTQRQTPCFQKQGVSNLRPSTWKSQPQTTRSPRRIEIDFYGLLDTGRRSNCGFWRGNQ